MDGSTCSGTQSKCRCFIVFGAEAFTVGMVLRDHLRTFIEGRTISFHQAGEVREAETLDIREAPRGLSRIH